MQSWLSDGMTLNVIRQMIYFPKYPLLLRIKEAMWYSLYYRIYALIIIWWWFYYSCYELITLILGLLILDFEDWRPTFRLNFGSLEKYRNVSQELVKQKSPQLARNTAAVLDQVMYTMQFVWTWWVREKEYATATSVDTKGMKK